jgi:hypothetical protein
MNRIGQASRPMQLAGSFRAPPEIVSSLSRQEPGQRAAGGYRDPGGYSVAAFLDARLSPSGSHCFRPARDTETHSKSQPDGPNSTWSDLERCAVSPEQALRDRQCASRSLLQLLQSDGDPMIRPGPMR